MIPVEMYISMNFVLPAKAGFAPRPMTRAVKEPKDVDDDPQSPTAQGANHMDETSCKTWYCSFASNRMRADVQKSFHV